MRHKSDLPIRRTPSNSRRTVQHNADETQEQGEQPPYHDANGQGFRIRRPSPAAESSGRAQERVHILGVGSIGMLVAHSLRGIPDPPPVTLLFHRVAYAQTWRDSRQEIVLVTDGQEESRSGYDTEMAIPQRRRHDTNVSLAEAERLDSLTQEDVAGADAHEQLRGLSDNEILEFNKGPTIHNLVVTVKAPNTVSALTAIKHRLGPESTILFLQNGMGIIEDVNEHVFPDPDSRPHYLLGINSHGVHTDKRSFVATHAGHGTMSLGMPARRLSSSGSSHWDAGAGTGEDPLNFTDVDMAASSRYLLRTMTRTPVLAAVGVSPTELLKAQLEKLAVNCVINPLTALLDCRNGMLLYNMAMTRCMRLILSEVSSTFIRLPELQGLPNTNTRFSPERLETLVVGVANKTGRNVSSMLADVRAGNQTEIEYLNGYVVRRGEELGIHAGFNYMIWQLVRGKQQMVNMSVEDEVPFVTDQ